MNAADHFGLTPLSKAVAEGHTEITRLLIEAGADVDAKGGILGSSTVLSRAVAEGYAEIARLLREAGADVK